MHVPIELPGRCLPTIGAVINLRMSWPLMPQACAPDQSVDPVERPACQHEIDDDDAGLSGRPMPWLTTVRLVQRAPGRCRPGRES